MSPRAAPVGRCGVTMIFSEFSAQRLIAELGLGAQLPPGCERLLSLAHQASLFTDEGRPPRFVAALADPGTSRARAKRFAEPWCFDGRPDVLARLSFATSTEWSCLELAENPEGRLCAWGIGPVPEPQDADDDRGGRVALVEVSAPGCVRIETEHAIAAHRRGRWLSGGTCAKLGDWLPRGAADALVAAIAEPSPTEPGRLPAGPPLHSAAWDEHGTRLRSEARASARSFLAKYLRALLRATRRRGHGGSLLLLPEGTSLDHVARAGVSVGGGAFVEGPGGWSSGLVDHASWYLHWSLALEGAFVLAELADLDDAQRERTCRARMQAGRRALDADLQRASLLTQVDGAVVLSALLEPLAFGALLPVVPPSTLGRGRGARHASLESAVALLPGAIGIAVSHDGETTVTRAAPGPSVERADVLL